MSEKASSDIRKSVNIRQIQPEDNDELAVIIRETLREFGVSGPGTSEQDASIECMFETYEEPNSAYFIVDWEGKVAGGGGIAPLAGGPLDTCELQKMYLVPALRGIGLGSKVLETCLEAARRLGYRFSYLETRSNMLAARAMYLRAGFKECDVPMGATGHYGCEAWFVKGL